MKNIIKERIDYLTKKLFSLSNKVGYTEKDTQEIYDLKVRIGELEYLYYDKLDKGPCRYCGRNLKIK